MGLIKDTGFLVGTGVVVGGAVWWYMRNRGSGSGWGLSIFGGGGGLPGGTTKDGGPESGPLEDKRGDGGSNTEKTKDGTDASSGGQAGKEGDGKQGSSGSSGNGTDKGKSKDGKGGEGQGGGGIGGGSGGGVGTGEGSGMSGGFDDVEGGGDVDEGGGDGGEMEPLAGWGDLLIEDDLPKPDISENKLEAVGNTVYTLVGDSVFTTSLPGPLAEYNPELGLSIIYWADVALHMNYQLPPGRLDPTNPTHVPWRELWVFILQIVIRAENELNAEYDVEVE